MHIYCNIPTIIQLSWLNYSNRIEEISLLRRPKSKAEKTPLKVYSKAVKKKPKVHKIQFHLNQLGIG